MNTQIVDDRTKHPQFKDIKRGQFFQYGPSSDLFRRVDRHDEGGVEINAICACNAVGTSFSEGQGVRPVTAVIHVIDPEEEGN